MRRLLLAAAEAVYVRVNGVRRWLYRRGILRARRLPRPVISIGNITAGGAGKTPAVIALANDLHGRGYKVAVLTRGYGRSDRRQQGLVDSNDTARFGDEPVLIKNNAVNADVIVGVDRYENAIRYLSSNTCDVFVLDDGFQHQQIARDLDIVIDVDAGAAPFRREHRSALRDAHIVTPRRVAVVIPEGIRGKRVFAFAGLASNQQFFDALEKYGVTVAASLGFPDHHRYTPADMQRIEDAAAAANADAIVTTEKDAVKLDRSDIIAVPAVFIFEPEVLERAAALLRR